jgi:hypothetical protein
MFVGTWMQLLRAANTFVFRVAEAVGEAAKFILSFRRRHQEAAYCQV